MHVFKCELYALKAQCTGYKYKHRNHLGSWASERFKTADEGLAEQQGCITLMIFYEIWSVLIQQ